ncbi:MAG: hypothetical protein JWQ55_3841 [Rhodopila sp.]|jgi:hypothetical protein|nr:hypothetical protein [Rhodopila sp.]
MSRPPNKPRQNSMVQTSAEIIRVNTPAVLNATAATATIREPADLVPSPARICVRVTGIIALASLIILAPSDRIKAASLASPS